MATISINIPDPVATEVLLRFSRRHDYQPNIPDGEGGMIPNPETRAQFCRRIIKEYIINQCQLDRITEVRQTAENAESGYAAGLGIN